MCTCLFVFYPTIKVEPQSYEPPSPPPSGEGVHKSEMSVTLKSSTSLTRYCVVLFNFHEEYAMISIEHKLANTGTRASYYLIVTIINGYNI